jgi:release factor glutamine methyltransferase
VIVAGTIRLDQALRSAAAKLRDITDTPQFEAQILLASILDRERSWLLAHPEFQLDEPTQRTFNQFVGRVQQGEALPYVIGERWFFGRKFSVESAVLIPRPETELLVEAALDFLSAHHDKRRAVDVGTGSGCIAVTLCAEVSDLSMFATDRSQQALKIAYRNAVQNQVDDRIHFWVGDLLDGVTGEFDLICANLPYIPSGRLSTLEVARREPIEALNGGEDGLKLVTRLIKGANKHLVHGGRMILEIDETQGDMVVDLAKSIYPDWSVALMQDLAGMDRVLVLDRDSHTYED